MWGGTDILMARQPFLMAKQYDPKIHVISALSFVAEFGHREFADSEQRSASACSPKSNRILPSNSSYPRLLEHYSAPSTATPYAARNTAQTFTCSRAGPHLDPVALSPFFPTDLAQHGSSRHSRKPRAHG